MAQSTPFQHFINVVRDNCTRFEPEVTFAGVGDIVVFNFTAPGQAVIRGEYAKSTACGRNGCDPCMKYGSVHPDDDDDYMFYPTPAQSTVTVKIEDISPFWFYSGILDECASKGVVGAINPEPGTSITVQRKAALAGSLQSAVDRPTIAPNGTTIQPTSNSSSTAHAIQGQSTHNGVSHGTIAGIVIGAIALILAGVATVYLIRTFLHRRKERAKQAFEPRQRLASPPPVLSCRAPSSVYTTRLSAYMHAPVSPVSTRNSQDEESHLTGPRTKSYTNLASNPYESHLSPRLPPHPAFRREAWF